VVALLLLATVASAYPWQWAARGAVRSAHRLMGDVAVALGNDTAAEVAYRRALAADDTADVAMALGNLYLRQGQPDAARAAYLDAWEEERHYIAASARYADMLRRQGELEEARRAFVGFYVSEQQVLDWSWAHLEPPPTTRIQVGDGLDFGYVGGMYQDEAQQGAHARWTDGRGLLRLAAPLAGRRPAVLRLRLAAPRPNADHIEAQVCMRGHCQPVPLMPTWREVALLVPPDPYHQHMVVELRSPTFQAPDGRSLGVLVDWAAVELPGASRADAP
jgi:tetratricopeptide (TPR) repeat protein